MPDPIYRSVLVTQIVNKVLLRGKRSTAERIVYGALSIIEEKTGSEPLATLKRDHAWDAWRVRSENMPTFFVNLYSRPRPSCKREPGQSAGARR